MWCDTMTARTACCKVGARAAHACCAPCRSLSSYTVGIMGDLHLEPGKMALHDEARRQFAQQLRGDGARVVQLGDLGGYTSRPGSRCTDAGCACHALAGRAQQDPPPTPAPGAAGVYTACDRQPATAGSVTCRRESLKFAEQYLAAFGVPRALVTGNHDLEGEDFDTDEDNLEAWRQVLASITMRNTDRGLNLVTHV